MDVQTFDGVFFITICTLACAGVTVLLKMMYKSKCSEFTCAYGCITLKRDINSEVQLDEENHEKEEEESKK